MQKETINIKTANGKVAIVRTADKATITEERTCFGFKEVKTTIVTKLDDTCIHYVFDSEAELINNYKNN